MRNYPGHILTEDIVVNYKNADRDDCLHFLTDLDTTCKDLASFVSPTAKRIYTSVYNAWFLKFNFNVENVQGFVTNKCYKIIYRGNKYIYSFIDSKFTAGSVALLLHGTFGTYLYTGNFCYYPSFVKSPVLFPVIEKKALTRVYLDNTFYEQHSNFLGFDEIVSNIVNLLKSNPMRKCYIYAEKESIDPLLAEIAVRLGEKIYVCQSTMGVMKLIGYDSYFTRHCNESRIIVDKNYPKKREFDHINIAVHMNRYSEYRSFKKIEKKGNVYTFNFYCHSNHKEICELLRILKPETMTFLFSKIDKAKISYDCKFIRDFSRTVQLKGVSNKSVEGLSNKQGSNIPSQSIKPTVHNNNHAVSKISGNNNIIITMPKNKHLLNLNIDNGVKNFSSENEGVIQLPSTEFRCPLRILDVPEINNGSSSKNLNCTNEDPVNKYTEINNSDKKTPFFTMQSHSSIESFHNYHKHRPEPSLKFIKLQDNNLVENTAKPNNIKTLSPDMVNTKLGVPLIFKPELVTEARLNKTNSKIKRVSNVSSTCVFYGKKIPIIIKNRNVNTEKSRFIRVSSDDAQNTNYIPKYLVKDLAILSKSKMCDTNTNIGQSSILNVSKFPDASKVEHSVSIPNNSFQMLENSLVEPQETISSESGIRNKDIKQLEASRIFTIAEDRHSDSLADSVELQLDCEIKQHSEMITASQLQGRPTSNQESSENNLTVTTVKTFTVDNKTNDMSPNKLSTSELEQLNKSTKKESKLCKNNGNQTPCNELQEQATCNEKNSDNNLTLTTSKTYTVVTTTNNKLTASELGQLNKSSENECENVYQAATEDICSTTEKRCLPDDESGLPRKKLRNDSLRQRLVESNCQEEPVSLRDCSVFVRRNGFNRSYFYCVEKNCFLPKFCGFKKHEIRPRTTLIALRNLQKLLNN